MPISSQLAGVLALAALALPCASQGQGRSKLAPEILSAKSVYFEDQTGVPQVAGRALQQLRKWGRFPIVEDPQRADLIILLSADPYKGGHIATAGGQTGTLSSNGTIDLDPVPTFHKPAPIRYAYLTVIDPRTEESLWSDSHPWGGLLTGFDSVGERLVKKLEKQMRK